MKHLVLAIVLCSGSCNIETKEPTKEPSDCERACARMAELECPMAEPDEEGNSCATICEETMEAGLIDLDPASIAESDTCPAE